MQRFGLAVLLAAILGVSFTGAAWAQTDAQPAVPAPEIPTQAYLGLGVAPLHPALTSQLPEITGKGRGVLVAKVMKGSPAEQAGLREHDIVIRYDDQDVYSPEQFVKLVRNDEPGRETKIGYVRGGKVHEVSVQLAETPVREAVRGRTAFRRVPDERRTFQGEPERGAKSTGKEEDAPWATFKSLTLTKLDDNRYKAEIEYRDRDKKLVHREFIGTREEIRRAIESDESLPADEREHLLRSLDQQRPGILELPLSRAFRNFYDLDRELFNWPHLDF